MHNEVKFTPRSYLPGEMKVFFVGYLVENYSALFTRDIQSTPFFGYLTFVILLDHWKKTS